MVLFLLFLTELSLLREDTLLLQKEHPQMVFMKESLGKMISLAYFQRIEQTLPDQFKTLIPEEATKPQFKYLNIPSDGMYYLGEVQLYNF